MADGLVGTDSSSDVKILEYITEPFTDLIVQIDSSVLDQWALGECQNCTLLKEYCPLDEVIT